MAGNAAAAVGLSVGVAQDPSDPVFGQAVSYQIVVTNTGNETLDNLTVVDTVSSAVTGVTAQQPAVFGAPVLSSVTGATRYEWSATGLAFNLGESYTFTLTGQMGLVCATTGISNSLSVTGGAGASSTTLVAGAGPFNLYQPGFGADVTIFREPAEVAVGGELLYRIVVENLADSPIVQLSVVDTIAPVLTNIRTFQPTGFGAPTVSQVEGGTRYEWSADGLLMAIGETYTFSITGMAGSIAALTSLSNTVCLAATSGCGVIDRPAPAGAQSIALYDYLRGQGIPVAAPDPSHPRGVKLTWQPALPGPANYAVSGYLIYRSDDGGGTTSFVTTEYCVSGCDYSILDIVPEYGKRYAYIIHPVDINGNVGRAYHLAMIDIVLPSNRLFLDHNAVRPDRGQYLSVHFQITEPGRVRISVMTPTGELIKKIYDAEHLGAISPEVPFYSRYQGLPAVIWDVANASGRRVTSGIYFIIMEIGESRDIKSVAVIR